MCRVTTSTIWARAELRAIDLDCLRAARGARDVLVRDEGGSGVRPDALRAWTGGLGGDDQLAWEATGNSDAIANLQDLAEEPWVRTVAVPLVERSRALWQAS
jgi:hypothetical protein